MADVAARREARRRRILENSEKRLGKITGAFKTDVFEDSSHEGNRDTVLSESKPFSENESRKLDSPSSNGPSPVVCGSFDENYFVAPLSTGLGGTILSETPDESSKDLFSTQSTTTAVENKLFRVSSLYRARIHIILLAVLVRTCYAFNIEYLFGEAILIPFGTLEFAELIMSSSSSEKSNGGITSIVICLCGMSPQQAASVNKFFKTLRKCVEDFNLYFFIFVVTHIIFLMYL